MRALKMTLTEIEQLPVHPAAAIFPMIPEDDLDELAEDIKVHGQREPVVVLVEMDETQPRGQQRVPQSLLDGRNRVAACRLAGVEPMVKGVELDDPVAFVVSANISRRHMTKGQIAMVIAKLYPEGNQGKRTSLLNNEVSGAYVRQARAVMRWRPDLVDDVLSLPVTGRGYTLSQAYNLAQGKRGVDERNSKIDGISEETKAAAKEAGFDPETVDPRVIPTLEQIAECEREGGDSIKLIKKLAKKRDEKAQRQAEREGKKRAARALREAVALSKQESASEQDADDPKALVAQVHKLLKEAESFASRARLRLDDAYRLMEQHEFETINGYEINQLVRTVRLLASYVPDSIEDGSLFPSTIRLDEAKRSVEARFQAERWVDENEEQAS